jgi:hypothetical protein
MRGLHSGAPEQACRGGGTGHEGSGDEGLGRWMQQVLRCGGGVGKEGRTGKPGRYPTRAENLESLSLESPWEVKLCLPVWGTLEGRKELWFILVPHPTQGP